MANYKLITHTSAGQTSEELFEAGATNTVVSSITAKDGSGQTAEVLIQKGGTGTVVEMAEVSLTSNTGFQIIDVAFALEAGDKVYIRSSRGGMKFIMSYVEETDVPNDTALGGLLDVDTSSVSDGESLVYNASNSQWEPQVVTGSGSGSSTLDGLTDTAISSPQSGNILRWNGNDWVNTSHSTSIISEGINLFYTDARVDARIAADTTKADANHQHDHNDITDFDTATNALIAAHPDLGEDNVNADWNATSGDAEILNKPALFSGAYADLTGKPSLFDGDYNSLSNQPSLFSGAYADLTGKPSIPADLDDLSNVSSTAPSPGEVLKWNGSAWAPATDLSGTGGGAVDSVNTQTGAVVLDADDIDDSSTSHKFVSQTEMDKLDHITITTDVNITTLKNLADTNNAGVLLAASTANAASANLNTHEGSLENHDDIGFDYTAQTGQPLSRPDGAFIVWDQSRGLWCDTAVTVHDGDYTTLTNKPALFDGDYNSLTNRPTDFPQTHETAGLAVIGQTGTGAEKINFPTTVTVLIPGDVYSLGATGWEAADNTTASADKMLAIPCVGYDDGSEMLIKGAVKIDLVTSGAAIGDPVYLGVGNKATLTPPPAAAYVIKLGRVLGTAGEIFFNPDSTSIKVQ
jgi:hypothetical protein